MVLAPAEPSLASMVLLRKGVGPGENQGEKEKDGKAVENSLNNIIIWTGKVERKKAEVEFNTLPKLMQQAYSKETFVMRQVLTAEILKLKELKNYSLGEAVSEYMQMRKNLPRRDMGKETNCWNTVLRLAERLMAIPMFKEAPEMKYVLRSLEKKACQEVPNYPYPAKPKEIWKAAEAMSGIQEALYLILWAVTDGRPGDTELLRAEWIVIEGTTLHITIVEGKTVGLVKKPFTCHTSMENVPKGKMYIAELKRMVETKQHGYIFTQTKDWKETAVKALKKVNAHMEARSVRRGMTMALAESGMPEDLIRSMFTGHKDEEMLMRYLGWGRWRCQTIINESLRAAKLAFSN